MNSLTKVINAITSLYRMYHTFCASSFILLILVLKMDYSLNTSYGKCLKSTRPHLCPAAPCMNTNTVILSLFEVCAQILEIDFELCQMVIFFTQKTYKCT